MHHLDRAGDVDQGRGGAAEVARDQHQQQRTHALARAQGARAHGPRQQVGVAAAVGQQLRDAFLEFAADGVDFRQPGISALFQVEPAERSCRGSHAPIPLPKVCKKLMNSP